MNPARLLTCDGCGQLASPEHIARRLRRLELCTRYRPVHIQTLILGTIAPESEAEFLYAEGGPFQGEAAGVLKELGVSQEGKERGEILGEFQHRGYFLTHVLECPLTTGGKRVALEELLRRQGPALLARIRHSLKPKKVQFLSSATESRFLFDLIRGEGHVAVSRADDVGADLLSGDRP